MIEGAAAALCLFCIPLLVIIPFCSLIWALRKGAPTDLRRSGAVAGLVAGAPQPWLVRRWSVKSRLGEHSWAVY